MSVFLRPRGLPGDDLHPHVQEVSLDAAEPPGLLPAVPAQTQGAGDDLAHGSRSRRGQAVTVLAKHHWPRCRAVAMEHPLRIPEGACTQVHSTMAWV